MNGPPEHTRYVKADGPCLIVACPCGWSVALPVRSLVPGDIDSAFRRHMADEFTTPTPDRFTADLSVRPGITIPPLTLLVSCLVGLAMWVAIGAAVIGVLR